VALIVGCSDLTWSPLLCKCKTSSWRTV